MSTDTSNFLRKWHRDIGYFFVGLIISFSISGIALNHRTTFNSRSYTYLSEPLHFELPQEEGKIDEAYVKSIIPELGVDNEYRTFRIRNGSLRVYYEDAQVEIDIVTGDGEREWLKKRILLAEMADLHQTTNSWWVWYSDIFGIGMLLISLSGMFMVTGKNGFKKRGWWLATIGLVFPLIFLIFII